MVAAVVVAFTAAFAFIQVAQPKYEAQSRVMLDVVKPDPVTGQVLPTPFLRAYTKTQIELVKDNQVAARVVNDLQWASNAEIQRWYRSRKNGADLDFERWASQQIVDGTSASLIEGSNILEITYQSRSPAQARNVAEALRKAYVDMSLQSRQEAAKRNAEWYEAQAEKARTLLLRSEEAKANFERQTGIVLQDDKVDIDSARLAALAQQGGSPIIAPTVAATSQAAIQLAQLDAELAQMSKTLGPNHPQLLEMRRRRETLSAQAAQERSASGSAASAALSAARATSEMLEAQKAKVMGQREQVERLRLMQDDITLRREQYNQAAMRAAQLRQEAEIAVTGVTPLGAAVTPQSPVFPNKPLIIGASIPLGAGLGLLIALLLEFVGQRIRGPDDLANVLSAPVLGVIQPRRPARKGWRSLLPNLRSRVALRPRSARV